MEDTFLPKKTAVNNKPHRYPKKFNLVCHITQPHTNKADKLEKKRMCAENKDSI